MSLKKVTYSLPALKTLLASENSCVYCIENCHRSLTILPAKLGDLKNGVKEYLSSKITTCDPELQGIILSHKNVKVIDSVQLNDDGNYRLDYIADTYIFKPTVGSLLTGVVNKKSHDYLGVLVHSVFNATIHRPRVENECPKTWPDSNVQIGQQVTFQVTKVIISSKLPFIKGKLVGVEEKYTEDGGDSGIGGHESTEERSSFQSVSDKHLDSNENIKKKKKKKKRSGLVDDTDLEADDTSLHNASSSKQMNNTNISDIESLLLNEMISNNSSKPNASESALTTGKKRKRESSSLDSDNSTLLSPSNHSSFPHNDELPKAKKKKSKDSSEVVFDEENVKIKKRKSINPATSEMEDTSSLCETPDLQSTIDSLLSIATNSLSAKKKKKKSVILNEEEINMSVDQGAIESSFDDSNVSEKRKKKKKHSESLDTTVASDFVPSDEVSFRLSETPDTSHVSEHKKEKKKKKHSLINTSVVDSYNEFIMPDVQTTEVLEEHKHKEKKKKKKSAAGIDLLQMERDCIADILSSVQNENTSVSHSPTEKKKKKKKSSSVGSDVPVLESDEIRYSEMPPPTLNKVKKKKSSIVSFME